MAKPISERTILYRFYDTAGVLLYVDLSSAADMAIFPVPTGWPWWPQVTHATAEWHPDRAAALKAEAEAIRGEGPVHNQLRECAWAKCDVMFYRGENGSLTAEYCSSKHERSAAQARWRERAQERDPERFRANRATQKRRARQRAKEEREQA